MNFYIILILKFFYKLLLEIAVHHLLYKNLYLPYLFILYPSWESNPDPKFRRLVFYPLNYRGIVLLSHQLNSFGYHIKCITIITAPTGFYRFSIISISNDFFATYNTFHKHFVFSYNII